METPVKKQSRLMTYLGEILFAVSAFFAVIALGLLTWAPLNVCLALGAVAIYAAVASYQLDKGGS